MDPLVTHTQFIWEDVLMGRRGNTSSGSGIRLDYPMFVTHNVEFNNISGSLNSLIGVDRSTTVPKPAPFLYSPWPKSLKAQYALAVSVR